MKKVILSILVISLLLLILTACGVEAKQSEPVENNVIEASNPEESEIGLIEDDKEADKADESNSKLYIAYQATYDSCISYTSTSLEEQLGKEVRDLKIIASGFVTLPENYAEDYKAWRIENCGTGFTQASTESEAEAPVAEYGFTDADEMMYTTGTVNIRTGPGTSYDKIDSLPKAWSVHRIGIGTGTADGWSLIEFEDGSTACVSSNYLSYTKPSTQAVNNNGGSTGGSSGSSGGKQQSTTDPDLEAKLAALGADSGPSNYVDPTAGLTEEQIQQDIEDSYNTEFRVNGT